MIFDKGWETASAVKVMSSANIIIHLFLSWLVRSINLYTFTKPNYYNRKLVLIWQVAVSGL